MLPIFTGTANRHGIAPGACDSRWKLGEGQLNLAAVTTQGL